MKQGLEGRVREESLLEDIERVLIETVLIHYHGHRERTAAMLGMGVRTLGMKLKQWREEAGMVAGA